MLGEAVDLLLLGLEVGLGLVELLTGGLEGLLLALADVLALLGLLTVTRVSLCDLDTKQRGVEGWETRGRMAEEGKEEGRLTGIPGSWRWRRRMSLESTCGP